METTVSDELKEQQRDSWNKFSGGWKKWDSLVMDWLKPVGEKLIEAVKLQENDQVLDCATGTGEPGLTAASHVKKGKVIATDLSEKMVNIANANAAARAVPNYEACQCDTDKLPYENNFFDAVICRFGIIFFPDVQQGVNELVRVLKPGRKMTASVWAAPSFNPWASVPMGIIRKNLELPPPSPEQPGIFRCAEKGYTTSLFRNSGLTDTEEIEVSGKLYLESPQRYWEFMKEIAAPIANALDKANEEQRIRIGHEIMSEIENFSENGQIALPWTAYVISGKKA